MTPRKFWRVETVGVAQVCPIPTLIPVDAQLSYVFSDGAECEYDGTRIPTLYIKEGFYRFSIEDHHVYECMFPNMCLGSSNETFESRCSEGSMGPECGVCKQGYYFSTTFEMCEPCSDATSNSTLFIIGIVIMLLLAFAVWLLLNPTLLRRFLRPRSVNMARNLVSWLSQLWSESLVAQCKIVWTGEATLM